MNYSEINTKVDRLTHTTDTGGYSAAERLIDFNNAQDEIQMEILKAQDGDDFDDKNYTENFPIRPANLKAGQNDYTIPSDMIKFKRLEISYDGTNWYYATPLDVGEYGIHLKSSYFSESNPRYDLRDNSIIIYPTPTKDITDGLKVWISRQMYQFTSSDASTGTKEPGFDRAYHKIIPYKMALEFAYDNIPEDVNKLEAKVERMLEKMRSDYSFKQQDRDTTAIAKIVNYN